MTSNTIIDVVIPAYNEEVYLTQHVQRVIAELQACGTQPHIIIVDDGSSDATWQVIGMLSQSHAVTGVRLSHNFGQHSAIFAGLRYVKGQAVFTMDADGQHPVKAMPTMIAAWRKGYLIVRGRKSERIGDSWKKRYTIAIFDRIASLLSGINICGASDFCLFDQQVVPILLWQHSTRLLVYRLFIFTLNFPSTHVDIITLAAPRPSRWRSSTLIKLAIRSLMYHTRIPVQKVMIVLCLMLLLSLILAAKLPLLWMPASLCVTLLCITGIRIYLQDKNDLASGKNEATIAQVINHEQKLSYE